VVSLLVSLLLSQVASQVGTQVGGQVGSPLGNLLVSLLASHLENHRVSPLSSLLHPRLACQTRSKIHYVSVFQVIITRVLVILLNVQHVQLVSTKTNRGHLAVYCVHTQ
jgi:hypothetical protein